MLRRMIGVVLFVLLGAVAQAEPMIVHSPGDGYLNMRSEAGADRAVIKRLKHGEKVHVLMRFNNGWFEIIDDDGEYGYVFAKYLRRPAENKHQRYISSPDGVLSLRTGPGTQFDVIREMENVELVQILERKGKWVRVRDQYGETGWAFEKYLK